MNVQKFITELRDGISHMYDGARSPELSDAYRARVDFVMWLRDSDAPDDLKQNIKTVINKTLLREDMPEIEGQIYNVLSNYGIDVNSYDDAESKPFTIDQDSVIHREPRTVAGPAVRGESRLDGDALASAMALLRGKQQQKDTIDWTTLRDSGNQKQ